MRFSGSFFLHFSGGMSCKAEGAGARVGHGTYVEIENALYLFWSFEVRPATYRERALVVFSTL